MDILSLLDYGTMVINQKESVNFTPTITDANIQPTQVIFSVGDWTIPNGTVVVDKSKTTIDGNAESSDIVIDNVNADSVFVFETTLEFTSATAYTQSIGKTITQTTTLTPIC